jgi:hypothetical protein
VPAPDNRFAQFQLRHLLGLVTVAAVLLAAAAPYFRQLERDAQVTVLVKTTGIVAVALAILVGLLYARGKALGRSGPVVEHCQRLRSRILSWLVAASTWAAYASTLWTNDPLFRFLPFAGSPVLLFFAINYCVIRFWWQIDPQGLEACEHGLILGGFQFIPWEQINRYSWSGAPAQLNLFLATRMVLNLKVDAADVERLDRILATHLAPATANR